MAELVVPELVEDPFREHYRELIVGSIVHSALAQSALYRERRNRRRALQFERVVVELGGETAAPPPAPEPVAAVAVTVDEPVVATPVVEPATAPVWPLVAPAPAEAAVTVPPAAEAVSHPGWPLVVAPSVRAPAAKLDPGPVSLPASVPVDDSPWFGSWLRTAATIVWCLTLAFLVCNLVVFGFRSWAAGAADFGLMALTIVWFAVRADDFPSPRARRTTTST